MSYIHEPVYISNPMTREYMNFPRLEVSGGSKVDSMVCGFGYLPSLDKYKIIKIYYIQNQVMGRVQVYTLGAGRCSVWRDIGETPYSLRHIQDGFQCGRSPFGAFANGALNWLDKEQKIVSLRFGRGEVLLAPITTFCRCFRCYKQF
ncbi:uncharacterized protein LOC113353960 [Papaver somniferum]|uniref:uncharacterized protein LOC113353960 n=1 Tax=Papaver somniferum TaxID=3469 RepID=UPI000E6FE991|nr:uncharacterized protein LOC113353960 [Papaver somniferum]